MFIGRSGICGSLYSLSVVKAYVLCLFCADRGHTLMAAMLIAMLDGEKLSAVCVCGCRTRRGMIAIQSL